jgi:3-oxoacyl-[acyl-carrier protein] reductase
MIADSLAGKVALITGVSRKAGIGAAIAHVFARAGIDVFTTYYRPYDELMPWGSNHSEAEDILTDLKAKGVRAEGMEADLSDPEIPAGLFDYIDSSFGFVDILVNNAVCDMEADVYSLSASLIDRHYAVNVRAAMLLCAEFAKRHDGRPGGRIINLSSGQGAEPMPGNLPYAATKGAIEAFTLSLSASLAGKCITVNAIDPGPTDTGWLSKDLHSELVQRAPFGRIGTPDDAARLVHYLASSEAQWITGQIIRSRGGL